MWKDSLQQVLSRPVTHWHRCKFGMLCALVPVVWEDRRLAVCQMVCAQSEGEEHFERAVEMLEVLIENYLARDAEYLAKRIAADADEHGVGDKVSGVSHPGVRRAIGYIERNISNPSMTVASVAREAEMNPSYMAHLFSQQDGLADQARGDRERARQRGLVQSPVPSPHRRNPNAISTRATRFGLIIFVDL
jgi:AraC-like DNA-binding protein